MCFILNYNFILKSHVTSVGIFHASESENAPITTQTNDNSHENLWYYQPNDVKGTNLNFTLFITGETAKVVIHLH